MLKLTTYDFNLIIHKIQISNCSKLFIENLVSFSILSSLKTINLVPQDFTWENCTNRLVFALRNEKIAFKFCLLTKYSLNNFLCNEEDDNYYCPVDEVLTTPIVVLMATLRRFIAHPCVRVVFIEQNVQPQKREE